MFRTLLRTVLAGGTLFAASCLDRQPGEGNGAGESPLEDRQARVLDVVRSDPSAEFSMIASVAVAADGRIFVADTRNAEITILTAGGGMVGTRGRRGEGPGEFDELRTLQTLPGDSLLAFDFSYARVTIYEPGEYDVAYTTSIEVPPTASRSEWFARATSAELFVGGFVEWARADRPPAAGEDEMTGPRVVRTFGRDGRLASDSMLVGTRDRWLLVREGDVIGYGGTHPFGPWSPIVLGGDERLYVGGTDTDSVRVNAYTLAGDSSLFFASAVPPRDVTSRDIEHVLGGAISFYHDAIRETAPDQWPAIRDLTADDRGRIWVTLGGSRADSTRVWVIEADGSPSFRITLAPGLRIEAVRGDRVYGVRRDELDVPRVEIHRFTSGAPAASVSGDF